MSQLNVVRESVVKSYCTRGFFKRAFTCHICMSRKDARGYAGNVSPEHPNATEYHVACL